VVFCNRSALEIVFPSPSVRGIRLPKLCVAVCRRLP